MKKKLSPILLLVLLAGCGHTSASRSNSVTSSTSRYAETETEKDGANPQSTNNDRNLQAKASKERDQNRKVRLAILLKTLDLAGESLAASAVDRRMHPGVQHDRNDRVEALLYAMLIRLGVKTLRDVTSGLLEDE